jgi:MFS transporter, DHA2 family, multidrug resistance protein
LQPIMLQQVMGYSAKEAGIMMAPRGLASAVGMVFVARCLSFIDPRWFIFAGLSILVFTTYLMTFFSLDTSFSVMAMVSCVQGFGVGLFFVPLLVFSTLDRCFEAEASGIFNFARNLGTSIGISLVTTFLSRQSQINWNHIGGHFTVYNPNLQLWLRTHHMSLLDSGTIAYLSTQLSKQASMLAFVNTFKMIGLSFILALPLIFLLKKSKHHHLIVFE